MPMRLISELERIRYREGQLLAARDLQDDLDFEALLRQLHTRFLHNTWGIALGLEVKADSSKVHVWPGLAYDCYGREIVLTEPVEIGVPAGDRYLIIRYRDDAEFPSKPNVVAVCLPNETGAKQERPIFHALKEQPVFLWRRLEAVRLGEEIPLACWCFDEASNGMKVDLSVRRNARPLTRPYIGWGTTKPGQTTWEDWEEAGEVIGFQVIIDTSEAGFTRTPYYFAILQGDLWSQEAISNFIIGPFEPIADESADGFTFRIMLPAEMTIDGKAVNDDFANRFLAAANEQGWHVFWIGVEPGTVTFAGRIVGLPPVGTVGMWHIQVERETSTWLVRVSEETIIDASEAPAKLDTWAEIQARPVIDDFWDGIHIKTTLRDEHEWKHAHV